MTDDKPHWRANDVEIERTDYEKSLFDDLREPSDGHQTTQIIEFADGTTIVGQPLFEPLDPSYVGQTTEIESVEYVQY